MQGGELDTGPLATRLLCRRTRARQFNSGWRICEPPGVQNNFRFPLYTERETIPGERLSSDNKEGNERIPSVVGRVTMLPIVKQFDTLTREQILAIRSGTWGDLDLLYVL